MPCLQKYIVKILVKLDLKFEISDAKDLVKCWGKTLLPARKALEISGRISGENFGETFGNFISNFASSCFCFPETSFSSDVHSASPKPHPCNMPQANNRSCAAIFGKLGCRNCTTTFAFLQCGCHVYQNLRCNNEKQHCNIDEAALQEIAAFLPLSCGFQAPTLNAHV